MSVLQQIKKVKVPVPGRHKDKDRSEDDMSSTGQADDIEQRCNDLEARNHQLHQELAKVLAHSNGQQKELETLKDKLAFSQTLYQLAEGPSNGDPDFARYNSQLKALANQMSTLEKVISEKDNEIILLKQQLIQTIPLTQHQTELAKVNELYQQQTVLLHQTQQIQISQDKQAREAVGFLQKEIISLKKEKVLLTEKLNEQNNETQKHSTLLKEIENYKQNEKDFREKLTENENKVQSKEKEIIELKHQIESLKNDTTHQTTINSLNEQIIQVKLEKERCLNLELEQIKQELGIKENILQKSNAENEIKENEIQKLKNEIENKILLNSENQKEIERLKQELNVQENSISQLNEEMKNKEKEINEFKNQIELLKNEDQNVVSTLNQQIVQINNERQKEINELKDEMNLLRTNSENSILKLNDEIKNKDNEVNGLKNQIEHSKTEYSNNINSLNEQINEIKTEKEKEINQLKGDLVTQKNDSENSISQLNEEIKNKEKEINEFKNQIELLKNEDQNIVSTLNEQINSLNEQINSLNKQINSLNEEINEIKTENEKEINQLKDHILTQKNDSEAWISDLNNGIEVKENEIKNLKNKIELLENENENDRNSLNQQISEKEKEIEEIKNELSLITSSLSEEKVNSQKLGLEIEEKDKQIAELNVKVLDQASHSKSNSKDDDPVSQIMTKLMQAQLENISLKEKIDLLETSVHRLTVHLNEREETINTLLKKLHNDDAGSEASHQSIPGLSPAKRKSMLSLAKPLGHDESKTKTMEVVMKDVITKNIALQHSIDSLEQEVTKLRNENKKLLESQNQKTENSDGTLLTQ